MTMADVPSSPSLPPLQLPGLHCVEGRFQGRRGQQLQFCGVFPPSTRPRAVVLFLHGIGEHARRFSHVFAHLAARGLAVIAYDLVAHGRSDCAVAGVRAHADRFQHVVDDTNAFLSLAKLGLFPRLSTGPGDDPFPPLVIMGISFGALVGLHTVLSGRHKVAAAVLASPAVAVDLTLVLRLQLLLSAPLERLAPTAKLVPGVNFAALTRDADFLADYLGDPLNVTDNLTTRMAMEILRAMRRLQSDPRVADAASEFCRMPLLVVQGSADEVTSVPQLEKFFQALATPDKTYRNFEGLFHCIFNEPEKQQVLDAVTDWLEPRVDAANQPVARL